VVPVWRATGRGRDPTIGAFALALHRVNP